MIQNTANKPLSELYSGDNKVTYEIPKYQREYVWGKWNWEALFDDINESEGGHFLGSIICVNLETDSHKPSRLELVDGQQRMATISLLYLSIYKYLKENLPEETDEETIIDQKVKLASLRKRIVLDNKVRLTPSYSNHNLEDYKWIFSQEIDKVQTTKQPRYLGLRRISKCFNYFNDRLNEADDNGESIYSFDNVSALLDKVNSATLVKIDVASHADAFTLFETLNNRGVPLSAIDLIKNKLLGQLEKLEENTLDYNFDRWNQLTENLTEEYKVQERFLRQFYNAFRLEKKIEVERAPKALRSNLIRIYEDLIERDVNYIFDRLEKAALRYSKHIQYNVDDNSIELRKALRNLENVSGVDGYMLLLFLDNRFEISDSDKVQLIDLLCKFFIRRNVTDTPPTRDLTNYFMEMIKQINSLDAYSFDKVKEIILRIGRPAPDSLFEEKLKGDLYEENKGATRYILASIESSKSSTNEKYVNFHHRQKKRYVWTIEHIFPQGKNIPQHWVDVIANGNKEKAKEIQNDCVHQLGNLTLTGYNSQLSNKPLVDKQNRKNNDGNYIGFKNGLFLNDDIRDIDTWTREQIELRTNKLVGIALEIFRL